MNLNQEEVLPCAEAILVCVVANVMLHSEEVAVVDLGKIVDQEKIARDKNQ